MILGKKTLEELRNLINEKTTYRSGPDLVRFFNELGFNDSYGQGFPSRWMYTDEKLAKINGSPEIDKCIKMLFSPINFIQKSSELDSLIADFNQYLAFDKWRIVRNNAELYFEKLDKIIYAEKSENTEDTFLNQNFSDLNLQLLKLDIPVTAALDHRILEIEKCYDSNAPLSVILLAGSTLEGILLGIASKHPKQFNCSISSPKNRDGKALQLHEWSLQNFIDVAKDIGLLQDDVHKFSHVLRDFRNYIHPFQQVSSGFSPTMHTAKICLQVLKAAIHQAQENAHKLSA